jgi:predicted metal-dependent hydrolase
MTSSAFPVEIIKTRRKKTASIKIEDGVAKVVVPEDLSDERIAAIIRQKDTWIREKLFQLSQITPNKTKEYVSGEAFSYLGKNYKLRINEGKEEVKLLGSYFNIHTPNTLDQDKIRQQLVVWFSEHAKDKLRERSIRYSKILNVTPQDIAVEDFKSRWGSCRPSGEIVYNWRVIQAPSGIIDYIVVHELCHLKHPNHSALFWSMLTKYIPEYEVSKQWLKDNNSKLFW